MTTSDLAPSTGRSESNGGERTELILLALLFGSVGAISWAIRGTSGWNGVDGTIVPGMAWGVLWYWAARRRGVDVRGVTLWLGFGIAIGGELGYGQYVSWIRGEFHAGDQILSISPATGFVWFALVGIGWGAPGGVALGWVLNQRVALHQWLVRLLVPLGVAMSGRALIQLAPAWFFPNYELGAYTAVPGSHVAEAAFSQSATFMWGVWSAGAILAVVVWRLSHSARLDRGLGLGVSALSVVYTAAAIVWIGHWLFFPEGNLGLVAGELDKHLSRTVYTNSQNALVVAWWIGAMAVAVWQRDRSTRAMALIIGGGFGIGMPLSATWCLGYAVAPKYIDWWKLWELNAGFNLGLLYLIALFGAARDPDKLKSPAPGLGAAPIADCWRALASAAGVTLVWFFLYMDDGLLAGLFLGPVYAIPVCWLCWRNRRQQSGAIYFEQQQRLTFLFCVFYLLFILLHGATSRLGVYLELYDEAAVDQYAWPVARLWMFLILVAPVIAVTCYELWRLTRPEQAPEMPLERVTLRIAELVLVLGLVGALTIWPSKIGVVYAVIPMVAIPAIMRFERFTPGNSA